MRPVYTGSVYWSPIYAGAKSAKECTRIYGCHFGHTYIWTVYTAHIQVVCTRLQQCTVYTQCIIWHVDSNINRCSYCALSSVIAVLICWTAYLLRIVVMHTPLWFLLTSIPNCLLRLVSEVTIVHVDRDIIYILYTLICVSRFIRFNVTQTTTICSIFNGIPAVLSTCGIGLVVGIPL